MGRIQTRGARCSFVVIAFRSCCDESPDRSFMVDPLSYFSFQPVLHDWCNKGRGMCYPVCGMMHITEHLLLIENSFLSHYPSDPLPYVRRHITVNKMCIDVVK